MSIYATDENNNLYKISGGSGTKVTLNGQGQREWSADFAESERQKSKNLFNKDAVLKNCEINGNTGEIVSSNSYWVSDYIRVFGLSSVYISTTKTSGSSNVFYDNNYNILSISSKTNGVLSIPSNAVYMRCNGLLSELENDIQIEKGTVETSYQPYNGAIVHEKDIQPNIATAKLDSDYILSTTNTYEKLPINKYIVAGNKLSIKDNAIYIGEGIKKVRVNAMVQFRVTNASTIYCAINKNANRISFVGVKPNAEEMSLTIPPFIIDTGENNYFTLWGYAVNTSNNIIGSSSVRTYLTIEGVE